MNFMPEIVKVNALQIIRFMFKHYGVDSSKVLLTLMIEQAEIEIEHKT